MRALVGLVVLLALAACGAVPKPFMPPPEDPYPLSQAEIDETVEVPPVSGVPLPMGKLLAERVADELTSYGVPAAAQKMQRAGYTLQGHAEASPPGLPYVAAITWRLISAKGPELGTYRHGVGGEWWQWDYGSPAVIEAVGEHVGEPLAKLVLGERYAGRGSVIPENGVWIGGVEGAPGDGNEALARALATALQDRNVPVTRDPETARYHLTADVEVAPPDNGQQIVRITWQLGHPDGREIGKARQKNAVPAGSLDQRWRQTATYAAQAAVGGIRNLIRQAEPASMTDEIPSRPPIRKLSSDDGDGIPPPTLPPDADLPQVPGRALPPS